MGLLLGRVGSRTRLNGGGDDVMYDRPRSDIVNHAGRVDNLESLDSLLAMLRHLSTLSRCVSRGIPALSLSHVRYVPECFSLLHHVIFGGGGGRRSALEMLIRDELIDAL